MSSRFARRRTRVQHKPKICISDPKKPIRPTSCRPDQVTISINITDPRGPEPAIVNDTFCLNAHPTDGFYYGNFLSVEGWNYDIGVRLFPLLPTPFAYITITIPGVWNFQDETIGPIPQPGPGLWTGPIPMENVDNVTTGVTNIRMPIL